VEGKNNKILQNVDKIFEKIEKNHKLILLIIITLGFAIRLYAVLVGFGSNHYSKIDELEAYEWASQLRYYGHPRFFTYIPGFYLTAIANLLLLQGGSVRWFYFFWVLLGTFTVYLFYWLTKKLFTNRSSSKNPGSNLTDFKEENYSISYPGNNDIINNIKYPETFALLVALIYAIFPWPVKFSVSYWNPHFIIPLVTLMLGYLYDVITVRNSKNITGLILTIALMPFFHMIIIYALPVIVIFLFIRSSFFLNFLNKICKNKKGMRYDFIPVKINFKYFLIGFFLSILIWIPFLYCDYKNGFFILKSYLKGGVSTSFKPEMLKILVNPVLITTNEISRFTGHFFFEYQNFLKKAYGIWFLGLIPVLASIILSILSFIYGFSFFNIKSLFEKKIDSLNYLLAYLVGCLFFHILSMQAHEDRYTIIFFPISFILLAYFIYNFFFSISLNSNIFEKFKTKKLKKIFTDDRLKLVLLVIIVLVMVSSFYITFMHFTYERNPNYKTEVRLIPSLIYYEDIKKIIIDDYLKQREITVHDKIAYHTISKERINSLSIKNHSLYNIYPINKLVTQSKLFFNERKNLDDYFRLKNNDSYKKLDEQTSENLTNRWIFDNPDIRYYFSFDYIISLKEKNGETIFISKDPNREKQIINCIERFINTNTNLVIPSKQNIDEYLQKKDKKIKVYELKFIPPDQGVLKQELENGYIYIGKLSNAILLKKIVSR